MHYQLERNYGCRVSDSWTYRGLKTVILENEILRIVVLADKGADVYQLVHKSSDVDFLHRSPWGVRDPSTFLPTTGDGVGIWMDTYEGGWQTVLPAGGFPSTYGGADMGLHAEVNTIPWDCSIIEDTIDRVSVKFSVRTYRTPFFFEKTLILESMSPVLRVEQTLTNESRESMDCVWGEHIALGEPFLSDKCVVDLPGGTIINHPVDTHPNNRLLAGLESSWPLTKLKTGKDHYLSNIPAKEFNSYDMSYVSDMPEGWYAVTNRDLGVGIGIVYPKDLYKYLWYWQSFGGGTGYPFYGRTFNVGLEPFTSYPNDGLESAINNGSALTVGPSQRIDSILNVVAFESNVGVNSISRNGEVELK